MATVFACIFGLIVVTALVLTDRTHSIDESVATLSAALRRASPAWLHEAVRDVTALGSTFTLVFVVLSAVGYLFLRSRRGAATFLLLSASGGIVAAFVLKTLFERARPVWTIPSR